jgi:hemoglobin
MSMSRFRTSPPSFVSICLLAFLVASCAGAPAPESAAAPPSLYEQLGERPGIDAVVDAFVAELEADERIAHYFVEIDHERFREQLGDQLCMVTGGPCVYEGLDMEVAHAGLGITHADFTALVEDLVAALTSHGVSQEAQNDLLALLGPLEPQIVEE